VVLHRLVVILLVALTIPVLLLGCNDSALTAVNGNNPSSHPAVDDDDGADDDDNGADDDDGSPYDDGYPDDDDFSEDDDDAVQDDDDFSEDDDDAVQDDDDPDPWLDDCPEGSYSVTDFYGAGGGDEIYVLSWDPTEASATLVSPLGGLFAVYDSDVYESGGSQTNESGFVRIRNSANPEGAPTTPNCGLEYIVQDNDNDGSPPAPLIYMGTFSLVAGANDLTLYHFCPLFRQGYCQTYHVGDSSASSGCDDSGPNSIHVSGEGFCLVPQ
jgi:hypothetical protein